MVRAKPKKVDVRVERSGEADEALELSTKGLTTVTDLGERLAEEMVTSLNIEDAFKLYYIDAEGDTMLVSAHTALRDLIYSDQITAKVDDLALAAPVSSSGSSGSSRRKERREEGSGRGRKDKEGRGRKKDKDGAAPEWDG